MALDAADIALRWSHEQPKSSWPIAIPAPVVRGVLMFFTTWHATMHLGRAGDAGERAWIFTEQGNLFWRV